VGGGQEEAVGSSSNEPGSHRIGVSDGARVEHGSNADDRGGQGGVNKMRDDKLVFRYIYAVPSGWW
jgi:hypothetical protein